MNFWMRVEMSRLGLFERLGEPDRFGTYPKSKILVRRRTHLVVCKIKFRWNGDVAASMLHPDKLSEEEMEFSTRWERVVVMEERLIECGVIQKREDYRIMHRAHTLAH